MQPQDQYATLLQICKENSQDLFNSDGNLSHGGRQPRCSDLELMALSLLQELFEFFGIELATPCCKNELLQYTMPDDYMRIRKRIEVIFSQLVDQLSIRKNYAERQSGLFSRIIAKVTLFTFLQYINMREEKEINQIRYTLAA